jgi:hypothetical protein
MQDYAKYRFIMLILINVLSAISTIVVGGLLIQALVSPSEIDTTGSLPITDGQPKINCRADICINEKAEELHTLTVQMVENLLNDQIVMNRHLVTMSGSFFVIFSGVLACNAIELGIFLNKRKNLKDANPTPQSTPVSYTTAANGDPETSITSVSSTTTTNGNQEKV